MSSGTAVDAEGSINFTDGLEVAPNPGQHRNDVRPNAALRVMAARSGDQRLLGVGVCTGSGAAADVTDSYVLVAGTFTGDASSDAMFTVATANATITYAGADAVRAVILVSGTATSESQGETKITVTPHLEGAPLTTGASFYENYANTFSFCGLTTLAQDDVLDLRVVTDNVESSRTVTITNLQMIVVLIGAV